VRRHTGPVNVIEDPVDLHGLRLRLADGLPGRVEAEDADVRLVNEFEPMGGAFEDADDLRGLAKKIPEVFPFDDHGAPIAAFSTEPSPKKQRSRSRERIERQTEIGNPGAVGPPLRDV
jgi:hypothetical protein